MAYVAAKLAPGDDLAILRSFVTLCTTVCVEPSLDHVVIEVQRCDLRKVPTIEAEVDSHMKSVGEF